MFTVGGDPVDNKSTLIRVIWLDVEEATLDHNKLTNIWMKMNHQYLSSDCQYCILLVGPDGNGALFLAIDNSWCQTKTDKMFCAILATYCKIYRHIICLDLANKKIVEFMAIANIL